MHQKQIDRYFFTYGTTKLVLYDARKSSNTYQRISEYYFGKINRALVSVPLGVYHAVENVGNSDALLFNFPNEAYKHEDPDKHTLKLDSGLIPYSFDNASGY